MRPPFRTQAALYPSFSEQDRPFGSVGTLRRSVRGCVGVYSTFPEVGGVVSVQVRALAWRRVRAWPLQLAFSVFVLMATNLSSRTESGGGGARSDGCDAGLR